MRISRRTIWIGIVVLFFMALLLLLFAPDTPVSFPVPVPNGYDDFLKASELVHGKWPPARQWTNTPNQEAVRIWMSEHAEAFSLVATGLTKPCRVPVRTSKDFSEAHYIEVAKLKYLTHCMIAKAELAAAEGRTSDAFEAYLETYRFAHEISRGGIVIDRLIQFSCTALVIRSFNLLIPALNPQQCAEAIKVIDKAEQDEENPRVVTRRTRDWQNATFDSSTLIKNKLALWAEAYKEFWARRSLARFDAALGQTLAKRQRNYQDAVDNLRERLRQQRDQASAQSKKSLH